MGPDGKAYDEVRVALTGSPAQLIRVTEAGETVISIAMPISAIILERMKNPPSAP